MRHSILVAILAWGIAVCLPLRAAAQTIPGSSLALKSRGSGSGDWTLDRNGYVGTYISLPAPGPVTINVNVSGTASGGIDPRMNIVIADTKAGFYVAGGRNDYQHTFDLPAGTYLVRAEFNNDLEQSGRALTVHDLTVHGATLLNSSSSASALAAADTYVQNFRKGNVALALSGLAPGTPVEVSLKRHAFNFGTAVPGSNPNSVNNYLGSAGTPRQTNYQQRLNQNFNALVPENAGKWSNNEGGRDVVTMNNVDQILNYAQSHNMRARMHNLLWGDNSFNGQQPSWVLSGNSTSGLLDQAYLGTNPNAVADLRAEITERIDYYVGTGTATDRAHKYQELDVYNESFHTGSDPNLAENLKHNYWNVYGAAGIADIYREVRDRIATSGAATKVFVNEYGVLGSGDYGNWYFSHIEELRRAGVTAGYGEVLGGIGVQHYPGGSQNAGNIMRTLQNLSVQGLPIALTEFGVSSGVEEVAAANILRDILRLTFGTADATGFFMWGFHQESGSGATTLFAPSAALYTVNTSDFNNWTITPAGRAWQDLLGIADWDSNPNNGWTTQLTATVDQNGVIQFNGFWGDYELTVGGETHALTLSKGDAAYSLVVSPGDFNADGEVDAADYVVWRQSHGSSTNLRADGNGDGSIDDADYAVWRAHFGTTYGGAMLGIIAIPEPSSALTLFVGTCAVCHCSRWRKGP
jgi:GH35 family endo-1,4-beta-xylanase